MMRAFPLRALAAFASGLVFAGGLGLSGMTDPENVLAFLNLRAWKPDLAFVMVGAIGVHAIGWWWSRSVAKPLLADAFTVDLSPHIDARLIGGAAIFGVGWGLVGYCPGPALVAAASGDIPPLIFVATMALGMVLCDRFLPASPQTLEFPS